MKPMSKGYAGVLTYCGVMNAIIMTCSSPATAEQLNFGNRETENGTAISVEEDFMNAKYPRHVIILAATNRGDADGALVFRCQQNSTEAYFVSGPYDFFGHSTTPVVDVRFPSDEQANRAAISLSSDGEAVFFRDPIEFMSKTVIDGSVGLMGSYYSGSFRHNYVLDDETKAAIYDLATTCEWSDRLPKRDEVTLEKTPTQLLSAELDVLIDEYGEDLFRQTVQSLLGDLDAPSNQNSE